MKKCTMLSALKRIIFIIFLSGLFFNSAFAQYQLEKLDRGIVAVSTGGSNVFISWRWLGTEDDITFNVYRNGIKINNAPLPVCNYTDNAGSVNASYTVKAIINGIEQGASEAATPWAQKYLKVPLNVPAGGTTPAGEAYSYSPGDCSVGDVDGDGVLEIFVKWDPSNQKDNSQSGYTGNVYIDCYTMKGIFLWRIDLGKNIRAGAHYTQFLVYDFDGDGKAEMACKTADGTKDGTGAVIGNATIDYRNSSGYILSGPEFLTVFNGSTGKIMDTENYTPGRGTVSSWGDNYGNRVDRFVAAVAYLDGARPSMIFGRGYYTRLVRSAWDFKNGQLTQRWIFDSNTSGNGAYAGQGNHQMTVGDMDGDGKQEFCNGASAIDNNGAGLFANGHGHGDALHMSDMDPDRAGQEVWQCNEDPSSYGNYGLDFKDARTGQSLWGLGGGNQGDIGRGMAADVDPRYKGYECWGSKGNLYTCKGTSIGTSKPSMNFGVYWDGDLQRELLDGTKLDEWDYLNNRLNRLATLYDVSYGEGASCNGTKATPNLSGDLFGDWREEVILHSSDNKSLIIYTTTIPSTYKFRTLLSDPQYRVAIAWQNSAYNQPPHLSYYLGTDMTVPAKPNITIVGETTTGCLPTITTPSPSFCAGSSTVLTASAGTSYKWFNGSVQVGTGATYTATSAGDYTVEVTTASGCKATSAIKTIILNPLPVITHYVQIDAGTWNTATAAIVCEGSTVQLGPHPNLSAGWSWTGPGNFSSSLRDPVLTAMSPAKAGTYTATYTDANGCKASSSFNLQVSTAAANITAPVTAFCTGGSAVLTANTGTGLTYQWSNAAGILTNATNATYTANAAGTYTVKVINTHACSATSASVTITANPLPAAAITTPATSFCAGGSVMLTASAGSSYKWFNGTAQVGTAATYTATHAGGYTVEVTNANGCKATSAVTQISVNPLPASTITAPATSFCAGGSVVLTASAGSSYKWFKGATQVGTAATYTATTAGGYTVEVTNANGCKATSAVAQISVNPLPASTITAPATSFCAGGSVVLTASAGSSYKWFNSGTQVGTAATYTATTAGGYTVEVTNANGCKATSAVTQISVNPLPASTITAPATSFCAGGSVVLTASAGSSYKWFNSGTQVGTAATYTATTAGGYTVEVTNANGCKATSAVTQISVTSAATWYADTDNDGLGDVANTLNACTKPNGYVATGGDACPADAAKTSPGACGCGNAETDTDADGTANCTDSDDDNDGIADANDCASLNAAIGAQITWYADTDGDGKGTAASTITSCTQPGGYVSIAGDDCPTDANKIAAGNCGCGNTEASCLDCAGSPNGTAFLDNCNICVGGSTGNNACVATATSNGTSVNIRVVPQPFDASTTIILENYGMIQSFTIISASGALVETGQGLHATEITLGESIAAGLYTVIITTDQGIYTTKIVKK